MSKRAKKVSVLRKVEIAATAYPGHMLRGNNACLSHVAEFDSDGYLPIRVLCRVKASSVLPDSSLYGPPEEATCPRCAARFRRLLKQSRPK